MNLYIRTWTLEPNRRQIRSAPITLRKRAASFAPSDWPAKMFNAPRPAQCYATAGPVNGLEGSFVEEDPLAISIYNHGALLHHHGLPPPHTRSLHHSARPLVTRRVNSHSCTSHHHVSSGCNSSWTVPQGIGYHQHLNTSEVSVSVLSRVQASSTLPAATIDRVPFFANRFLNKLIGFHTRLSTWVVQGPEYPLSSSL